MQRSLTGNDTICAVATPPGAGAIGVVRLSGPRAVPLVLALARRGRLTPRRLTLCTLRHPTSGAVLDRALVCAMPGPGSYTGEDMAEVQAHGGDLNLERIVEALLTLGARPAEPGELTRRAFLAGKLDLTQAEAIAEIIAARSDRALSNAQAVLRGELGRQVRALCAVVVELCAELEAQVDFAPDLDDQGTAPQPGAATGSAAALRHLEAARRVRALSDTYRGGQHLRGCRVVLAGPVNSGKSSIFNRILDTERAVVSPEPGTTRDYIEAEVVCEGTALTLVDTAGVREGAAGTGVGERDSVGAVERAGQGLGARVLRESHLGVWVCDLSDPALRPPVPPPEQAGQGPGLWVVAANKSDRCTFAQRERARDIDAAGGAPVVVTSARTGEGIEQLLGTIVRALGTGRGVWETVLVTRGRHRAALERAGEALERGAEALTAGWPPEVVVEHPREALAHLQSITGERYSEAVLDRVFATFCIGK